MGIVVLDDLSLEWLNFELQAAGRFVIFQCCISILVVMLKRGSSIHFVRSGERTFGKGLPSYVCSLLFGRWGVTWGPIWTIATIFRNCHGGIDVTAEVVQDLNAQGSTPPDGTA